MGYTTLHKAERAANRHAQQQGFTLVELMVALVLGLVLTAGIVALYTATLKSNSDLLKSAQLENELQSTMNLMVRDIRRAGYDGAASPMPSYDNPFDRWVLSEFTGEDSDSCLLFSYDLDNDGTLDSDEKIGYRLKNGAVQIGTADAECSDNNSSDPDWEKVTTASLVNVTTLKFEVTTTNAGEMKIRRVKITLAGQLAHDDNVDRTLIRYVTVRNNTRTS